jgi:hypothetical protein
VLAGAGGGVFTAVVLSAAAITTVAKPNTGTSTVTAVSSLVAQNSSPRE